MPYIKQEDRGQYDEAIDQLASALMLSDQTFEPGHLNYVVSRLILKICPILNYMRIAVVTGVLDNVSKEFYRRSAVPYEEVQCAENGDLSYHSVEERKERMTAESIRQRLAKAKDRSCPPPGDLPDDDDFPPEDEGTVDADYIELTEKKEPKDGYTMFKVQEFP